MKHWLLGERDPDADRAKVKALVDSIHDAAAEARKAHRVVTKNLQTYKARNLCLVVVK